jgi:hypothetical protein
MMFKGGYRSRLTVRIKNLVCNTDKGPFAAPLSNEDKSDSENSFLGHHIHSDPRASKIILCIPTLGPFFELFYPLMTKTKFIFGGENFSLPKEVHAGPAGL